MRLGASCIIFLLLVSDTDQNIITHLSYAALEVKANQLARSILQFLSNSNRQRVNQDGDYVITVCMHPSEKLIITLLAIWKVGAAYLPLDINTPISRMEHIFSEVNPLMMITDQKGTSLFKLGTKVLLEF